jgi:hypothetical protein
MGNYYIYIYYNLIRTFLKKKIRHTHTCNYSATPIFSKYALTNSIPTLLLYELPFTMAFSHPVVLSVVRVGGGAGRRVGEGEGGKETMKGNRIVFLYE